METDVLDNLVYDSFGQLTSQSNSSYQPGFTYDGAWQDPLTGLSLTGGTWYDAVDSVFLSMADPAATNPYEFAGDDPTNDNIQTQYVPVADFSPVGLADASGGDSGGGTPVFADSTDGFNQFGNGFGGGFVQVANGAAGGAQQQTPGAGSPGHYGYFQITNPDGSKGVPWWGIEYPSPPKGYYYIPPQNGVRDDQWGLWHFWTTPDGKWHGQLKESAPKPAPARPPGSGASGVRGGSSTIPVSPTDPSLHAPPHVPGRIGPAPGSAKGPASNPPTRVPPYVARHRRRSLRGPPSHP